MMPEYYVVQDRIHSQWKVERRSGSRYNYWHIATYTSKRAALAVAHYLNEHSYMESQ
jgi:hypothetical protein